MKSTNDGSTTGLDDRESSQVSPGKTSTFFTLLDRLLRQRESFFEEVFSGQNLVERMRWLLLSIALLSAFYGTTMGAVGFADGFGKGMSQVVVSGLKVPALYLLSLAICFPVLYIVLVLMGARLSFLQTLSLLLLSLALNSVLLASCAPILLFFAITGADYHFVKLLHVVVFAFSGGWAMMALWHGLTTMCEKTDLYPKQAIRILKIWILIFGFVGTQMAWSLRPFVGSPGLEFEFFRENRTGNFYEAIYTSAKSLVEKQISAPDDSGKPPEKPPTQ